MLRVLDLFSGIGGFSLGLERTGGFKTVAFCEIEKRQRDVLAKHWPGVPCHDDIRSLNPEPGSADIVCGGFPCQDLSKAGKRAGLSGSRSGLFRELVRAFRLVRGKFLLMENVADLLHLGMGDVCAELAKSGLRVEWDCIPAASVGAPHFRDRVWVVAYADVREQSEWPISSHGRRSKSKSKSKSKGNGHPSDAYAMRKLQPGWCFSHIWRRPFHGGAGSMGWREHWRDRLGALCRVDDGVSRRLDEAKQIGNAVCPDIPELIGRAILASLQHPIAEAAE